MTYTTHAHARIKERRINELQILMTIEQGKMFYRQGMKFFVHPNNQLVVVTSNNGKNDSIESIITAYCRANAIKYVKLKSKKKYKNDIN